MNRVMGYALKGSL